MKLTSNYNLKKPDGSDVVNINDFNDNVDKIDDEIKKVNVKADDMSFTTASNRVNIESGDTRKVVLGKIAKWFGELKGLAFKDKVAVGDLDSNVIAHDLTTTHVSKVLGADQGGVLLGKIGELNDNLMPLLKNVRGYENFTQKVSDMIIGNNFISTSCVISVDTPEYAPAQESSVWYNVLTVGIGNRCYQTAVQCFEQRPSTGVMYIRTQHDEIVSNWKSVGSEDLYNIGTISDYRVVMTQSANNSTYSSSIPLANAQNKNIVINKMGIVGETSLSDIGMSQFVIQKYANNFSVYTDVSSLTKKIAGKVIALSYTVS